MKSYKPKIAIDATALPKDPVGAGRYIINLVNRILILNKKFDIKIIAHADDYKLFNLHLDYKKYFIFIPDHGRGYRLFWEQVGLPWLLFKEKIDCYHGLHYTRPFFSPCPVVTTIHDMTFFVMPEKHIWLKRYFFRFFIIFSSNFSRLLLSVSNNTKKDLIKYLKISESKIMVTPLGVSEKYKKIEDERILDTIADKYKLPKRFILFVGLIEPRKNVPLLLTAFAEIIHHENFKNQKLVIAGRWGWGSEEIRDLVHSLGIESKVIFPGYIDEEDLPGLINLADLFVYPSSYEGFGLPVLEAMACGTPVITTNVSSMPEFVGDLGVLISPNDKQALVDAIITMSDKKSTEKFCSEQLIKKASQFTWKNTAELTLKAYATVLNRNNEG